MPRIEGRVRGLIEMLKTSLFGAQEAILWQSGAADRQDPKLSLWRVR